MNKIQIEQMEDLKKRVKVLEDERIVLNNQYQAQIKKNVEFENKLRGITANGKFK